MALTSVRYEHGNVVVAVEQIEGFGKNPGLWIGTNNPNGVWKVATFGSKDKALKFCKWLEYMMGLTDDEPESEMSGDAV